MPALTNAECLTKTLQYDASNRFSHCLFAKAIRQKFHLLISYLIISSFSTIIKFIQLYENDKSCCIILLNSLIYVEKKKKEVTVMFLVISFYKLTSKCYKNRCMCKNFEQDTR